MSQQNSKLPLINRSKFPEASERFGQPPGPRGHRPQPLFSPDQEEAQLDTRLVERVRGDDLVNREASLSEATQHNKKAAESNFAASTGDGTVVHQHAEAWEHVCGLR